MNVVTVTKASELCTCEVDALASCRCETDECFPSESRVNGESLDVDPTNPSELFPAPEKSLVKHSHPKPDDEESDADHSVPLRCGHFEWEHDPYLEEFAFNSHFRRVEINPASF